MLPNWVKTSVSIRQFRIVKKLSCQNITSRRMFHVGRQKFPKLLKLLKSILMLCKYLCQKVVAMHPPLYSSDKRLANKPDRKTRKTDVSSKSYVICTKNIPITFKFQINRKRPVLYIRNETPRNWFDNIQIFIISIVTSKLQSVKKIVKYFFRK